MFQIYYLMLITRPMWVQYLLLKGSHVHKILVEKLMMKRYQHEVALVIPPRGRRTCSLQISHLQNRYFTKTYLNEVAKHCVSWHFSSPSVHPPPQLSSPVHRIHFLCLLFPNWLNAYFPTTHFLWERVQTAHLNHPALYSLVCPV